MPAALFFTFSLCNYYFLCKSVVSNAVIRTCVFTQASDSTWYVIQQLEPGKASYASFSIREPDLLENLLFGDRWVPNSQILESEVKWPERLDLILRCGRNKTDSQGNFGRLGYLHSFSTSLTKAEL